MFMKFAHRGLYTSIPYLISFTEMFNPGQFMAAKFGHAELTLHATGMPRAQTDM